MKKDGFYDTVELGNNMQEANQGERVWLDERGAASFVEESEPASLKIRDACEIFIVHGGICCVAVLIALVVHIQKRRTSKRSSATDLVAGSNEIE